MVSSLTSPVEHLMAEPVASQIIRFGGFRVDLRAGELCKHGTRLKLSGQPFQVLALLLEHPGQVVTREELRAKLWPADTFVDFDHGLHAAMNKLREALGDSAENPRFVETLPRRGYRFIAAIDGASTTAPAAEEDAQAVSTTGRVVAGERPIRRLPLAAGLLVVVFVGGYFAWRHFRPRVQPPAGRIMLAVLPFENLSGDPEQEYFSDGLTEEMITQLGGLDPERLGVIARTSAMHYKGTTEMAGRIGRELGVDYLVEGSVRRELSRVRISAQLIRVRDQTHLWAQNYDRDSHDYLTLQSEVARNIAAKIELKLSSQPAARPARALNPNAYEAYLKGRYFWNMRSEAGHLKAIEYFQQAIAADPQYAKAYSGLADAYALLGSSPNAALTRHEAMSRARAAALKALALDDSLAEAHTSLGFIHWHYDWNWPSAEKEFRRALELNPSYPTAHHWYAFYSMSQSRTEEALEEIRRAREIDPLSLIITTDVAEMLLYAQRYDQAIEQAKRALEMDPDFVLARHVIAWSYVQKHQYGEALQELKKRMSVPGAELRLEWTLAAVYALAGQKALARDLLLQLKAESERLHTGELWMSIASVDAALGENEEAFAWLEKDFQARDGGLTLIKVIPFFDPVRSDPRFADLVRRIGLPP